MNDPKGGGVSLPRSGELAELLLNGFATEAEAAVLALRFAGVLLDATSRLADEIDSAHSSMREAAEQFECAKHALRGCLNAFARFPWCKRTLEDALRVSGYAEGLIAPALRARSVKDAATPQTYIVKSPESGLIKIGKSISPAVRIRALETAAGCQLLVLAIIDRDIERQLHEQFECLRVRGEWFRDDGSIARFARENA